MRRMVHTVVPLMLAFLVTAAPAAAQVFNGTTVGGATWNRPIQGEPPVNISAVGTDVPYHVMGFNVTAAGSYDFLSVATNPVSWDNFLFLYAVGFNPANPLQNVLISNDDFEFIGQSGFSYALSTGVDYFLVTTGFANNDAGEFTNTIRGPGDAVPPGQVVPEPMTMVLLGTGLAGVAAVRRRRRALA